MKLLKKYSEFVNEGLINYLKKNLRGLINSFSEETKNLAANVSKEIDKKDKYKDAVPFIKKVFTDRAKGFEQTKDYNDIKNFIKEDLMLVELLLTDLSQKFEPTGQNEKEDQIKKDNKKLKPNKFFEDSNNKILKQIFDQDNFDNFQGVLNNQIDTLMIEIGKKAGFKNPEEKFQQNNSQENNSQQNSSQQNVQKQNEAQEVDVDNNNSVDNNKNLDNDPDFIKFKKVSNEFRNNGLLKPMMNKLDKIVLSSGNELKEIVDTMTGSDNKDSLTKILQKIISSDKDTLSAVRDAIGFDKNDTPL